MTNIEIKDLRKWLSVFSSDNARDSINDGSKDKVEEVVDILGNEMKSIASGWSVGREIVGSLDTKVKVTSEGVEGRAGHVNGDEPDYAATQEAGRRAGAKPPPITELVPWSIAILGTTAVPVLRQLSRNISERGLPNTDTNPRQRFQPPTYVWRSYMEKESEIDSKLDGMLVEITKRLWRGL